jgi:hypothetical protein
VNPYDAPTSNQSIHSLFFTENPARNDGLDFRLCFVPQPGSALLLRTGTGGVWLAEV